MFQKEGKKFLVAYGQRVWHNPEIPTTTLVLALSKMSFGKHGGCWEWKGAKNALGYGMVTAQKKSMLAHRLMYVAVNGPIAEGMVLHHLCENPACANPKHLKAVTMREHFDLTPQGIMHSHKNKTHCIRGHPLDGRNLLITSNGHRRCRQCLNDWANRKNARLRAANPLPPKVPRTHCNNGHELTEENAYMFRGYKFCKICHNLRCSEHYHRKAEARRASPDRPIPNGEKTHCRFGHEFAPGNTATVPKLGGGVTRVCVACRRTRRKMTYYRKLGDSARVAQIAAERAA